MMPVMVRSALVVVLLALLSVLPAAPMKNAMQYTDPEEMPFHWRPEVPVNSAC